MILRIRATDFSKFSGYKYNINNNEELNKYIDLYKYNLDFKSFQIEDKTGNELDFHLICYIKDRLGSGHKMFVKTDLNDDGSPYRYWLCFRKEKID